MDRKHHALRGAAVGSAHGSVVVPEGVTLLAFAAGYALATVLGRATVLPDTGISVVWPAAGVSVLWITARARRPWLALDVILMAAITSAAVIVTGGEVWSAIAGGVAAAVQVAAVCAIIARWCPRIWRTRGGMRLTRRELWRFLFAAVAGPLVSAPLLAVGTALSGGAWTWDLLLLWFARNAGSIIVIVPLGFAVGEWKRRLRVPAGAPALRSLRPEWVLLLVLSPLVHVVWFLGFGELAVVFPLLAFACWAGARLSSPWVSVHGLLVAVACIWTTAYGAGPFLGIGSPSAETAAAQLYVVLVCVIGLALALDRDERDALAAALSTARDHAQAQAELYGTIVETMAEGVRVVDREGRVIVRNGAAARLLALPEGAADDGAETDAAADVASLRSLDGSFLEAAQLPFRRSLAGHDVRDLDLLVRRDGGDADEDRIVSFTTARLPETAGGGVVTVLRDVTIERRELHRAAQVQASLLPDRAPDVEGYELAARCVPAGSVGGDFYDWYAVDDGIVVTLADVMGKGPGAAILAATTRSMLRAHGGDAHVARTVTATEEGMVRDLSNVNAFVTMFHAHLHAALGEVRYTDAGHGLAAIITAAGDVRRLASGGLPLGLVSGEERGAEAERLEPGDMLVVVSDGVLDAVGGRPADLDRVRRAAAGSGSAAEAVAAVVEASASGVVDDDLTVLVLRRRP